VIGSSRLPASAGGEYPFVESYFFTDTALSNYQISTTGIEIANSGEQAYYCSDLKLGYTSGTIAGIPADNREFDSLGLGYRGTAMRAQANHTTMRSVVGSFQREGVVCNASPKLLPTSKRR
jgi:hypothetical protein